MDLTFEEIWAHSEAIEHYLDDPDTMARFREQLLAALRDPAYPALPNGQFDWTHFAREFSAPDFDPPLTSLDLFRALRQHFHQPGYNLPRARVWWLVRLVMDVEDPVAWLRQQQRQRRGAFVEIARTLDCPGITNVHLSTYLTRLKVSHKPSIPDRFQVEGTRLLALVSDYHFWVWGLECRTHGRYRLVWRVVFQEELDGLYGVQPPPYEQSPRAISEALTEQHGFQPEVILFYFRRLCKRETGRLWWGYWPLDEEREKLGLILVEGPIVVEEWDEDGWPVVKSLTTKKLEERQER